MSLSDAWCWQRSILERVFCQTFKPKMNWHIFQDSKAEPIQWYITGDKESGYFLILNSYKINWQIFQDSKAEPVQW